MNDPSRLRRLAPTSLWLAASLAIALLGSGLAQARDAVLTGPASAVAGSNVSITVDYENRSCTATDYRILTSILGNASNTLGGIGIYGPEVALTAVTVPAGSGVAFCGCGQFQANVCNCSGQACTTDADCPFCSAVTPSTVSVTVDVEPVLPVALQGSVSTVVVINEVMGSGENAQISECFVEAL